MPLDVGAVGFSDELRRDDDCDGAPVPDGAAVCGAGAGGRPVASAVMPSLGSLPASRGFFDA
jgi:hypothetical protein